MSGFTSIFGSSGTSKDSGSGLATSTSSVNGAEIKKKLQQQISQELAIANATELVNKITENCFEKCIPTPGSVLTSGENECTKQCMEKYMYAWNVISKNYISRIQQAGSNGI